MVVVDGIDISTDSFLNYLNEIIQNEKIFQLIDSDEDIIDRSVKIGYLRALQNVRDDYMDDLEKRNTFNPN